MFGGLDGRQNIWRVKLRVVHNPTVTSAQNTKLPTYAFTDEDWNCCRAAAVHSNHERALQALDYILITVPSPRTKRLLGANAQLP